VSTLIKPRNYLI